MVNLNSFAAAFEEHPLLASFIALVIFAHVLVLLWGFRLLWNDDRKVQKISAETFKKNE